MSKRVHVFKILGATKKLDKSFKNHSRVINDENTYFGF